MEIDDQYPYNLNTSNKSIPRESEINKIFWLFLMIYKTINILYLLLLIYYYFIILYVNELFLF